MAAYMPCRVPECDGLKKRTDTIRQSLKPREGPWGSDVPAFTAGSAAAARGIPGEVSESLLQAGEFVPANDPSDAETRGISSPGMLPAELPLKYLNDETIFSKSSFWNRSPVSAVKTRTLA